MQALLDHLGATIIAGTIFLLLVVLAVRNSESAVESANFYALKQQELVFLEILKRDLQNVTEVYHTAEDPEAMTFAFEAVLDSTLETHRITYQRVEVGTRDEATLYRVERYVDGIRVGGSGDLLTEWEILALDGFGNPAGSLSDGRQIFVRFEAMAPFKETETIRRAKWEARFRPPLLRRGVTL